MDIFFEGDKKFEDVCVGAVVLALKNEGYECAAVDILLTTGAEIQELNKTHRNIDKVTDCLSFPQYEKEELRTIDKAAYTMLGDVVICLEKAREQAEEYGHSLERELAFLAVHSTLHLLGYDHEDESGEKEMFGKQEEILSEAGYLR